MYKIGLVIGRFQPFHKGHLYLLKKALQRADKIIIAIGSSNIKDDKNPLSYQTRVKMLQKVIADEGLKHRITKIVPSPDDPSDKVWLKLLLEQTGKFDFEMGNNTWTNGILKEAGYRVTEIPELNRKEYQGTYIRALIKQNKNWQNLVPPYLVDFISKNLK